jgi:nitric oxide reductase activation protein
MALPCLAQSTVSRPPVQHEQAINPMDENEAQQKLAHDMEKKANEERAAAIKNDTDKLVKLALELKASVDKSNEHVLSVDVIKKAEEIEKLAHSVKDKMKGPN